MERSSVLGAYIVDKLEEEAQKKGYTSIVLETTKSWNSAISLHKRCGFVKANEDEENVYFEKTLDKSN